jgi:hypothetical protein
MSTEIPPLFTVAIVSFVFGIWVLVMCAAVIRTARVLQSQQHRQLQDGADPPKAPKPNFIVIARRHSKHTVRPRPRPRQNPKHPQSPLQLTIADKAEGCEEYLQPNSSNVFSLPLELREKIYHQAMSFLPTRYFVQPEKPLSAVTISPDTFPALCFTSKQLHREGLSAWIRHTRFVVDGNNVSSRSPLSKFLEAVDSHSHVRMLCFTKIHTYGDVYRFVEQSPQRLAEKCAGLRSLVIELDYYVLLDDEFQGLRTEEELGKEIMLKPLFKLQNLRYLKIEVLVSEWRKHEMGGTDGLGSLKELVRRGFEEVEKSGVVSVQFEVTVVEN